MKNKIEKQKLKIKYQLFNRQHFHNIYNSIFTLIHDITKYMFPNAFKRIGNN